MICEVCISLQSLFDCFRTVVIKNHL
jgi:hypothetical protein